MAEETETFLPPGERGGKGRDRFVGERKARIIGTIELRHGSR